MSTTRAVGLYMHAILLSRLSAPERLTRGASLGAHVSVERLGDDIAETHVPPFPRSRRADGGRPGGWPPSGGPKFQMLDPRVRPLERDEHSASTRLRTGELQHSIITQL